MLLITSLLFGCFIAEGEKIHVRKQKIKTLSSKVPKTFSEIGDANLKVYILRFQRSLASEERAHCGHSIVLVYIYTL